MNFTPKQKRLYISIAVLALVAIIAVSVVIAAVLAPKKVPVSSEYITVTIDNSVSASFTLSNGDYSLIAADTYNDADLYIVQQISPAVSFTQAMDTFISSLIEAQKLSGKENEVLLFGVESRNEKDFEALAGYFRDTLKKKGCSTRVYSLYTKVKVESTQKLADKYEVSYAKANLCVRLEKENNKLKAEELIVLPLSELVDKVNGIAKDDLVGKVESDTNDEQKNEFIPEEKPSSSSNSSSSDSSSSSSSESSPSDNSSSEDTSSDNSSSEKGTSFIVSSDDAGWLPGLH